MAILPPRLSHLYPRSEGPRETCERFQLLSALSLLYNRMENPAIKLVSGSDEMKMSKFNIFTLRANHRVYKEIIDKRNSDRQYIEALEALLREHNVELPEVHSNVPSVPKNHMGPLDGSPEALNALLMKVKDLQHIYHVQICFKNLGYWTMSPKPYIPTVGTTIRNMIIGHGPKERVDILKGLTGNRRTGPTVSAFTFTVLFDIILTPMLPYKQVVF